MPVPHIPLNEEDRAALRSRADDLTVALQRFIFAAIEGIGIKGNHGVRIFGDGSPDRIYVAIDRIEGSQIVTHNYQVILRAA